MVPDPDRYVEEFDGLAEKWARMSEFDSSYGGYWFGAGRLVVHSVLAQEMLRELTEMVKVQNNVNIMMLSKIDALEKRLAELER